VSRRTFLLTAVVVVILGISGLAQAQQPAAPAPVVPCAGCPGHGGDGDGHGKGMGKRTALTEEQQGKIDQLRIGHLKKMMPLRTDLQVKQMELGALWRADELNSKAIVAKVKEISGLRGQLELERVNHRLALYQVLTPEQRKMAHRFLGRFGGRGRRGMRGGPGMMGGPGMKEGHGMRGQGCGMHGGPGMPGKGPGMMHGKGGGPGGCGGQGDCGGSCKKPGGPE
jgi:Spy/CpxP family protein refolding chaperone